MRILSCAARFSVPTLQHRNHTDMKDRRNSYINHDLSTLPPSWPQTSRGSPLKTPRHKCINKILPLVAVPSCTTPLLLNVYTFPPISSHIHVQCAILSRGYHQTIYRTLSSMHGSRPERLPPRTETCLCPAHSDSSTSPTLD